QDTGSARCVGPDTAGRRGPLSTLTHTLVNISHCSMSARIVCGWSAARTLPSSGSADAGRPATPLAGPPPRPALLNGADMSGVAHGLIIPRLRRGALRPWMPRPGSASGSCDNGARQHESHGDSRDGA